MRYAIIWVLVLLVGGCAEQRRGGGSSGSGGGGSGGGTPPTAPFCEILPGEWTATYTKRTGTCDDIEPTSFTISRSTLDCGTFLVPGGCRCAWDVEECRVNTICSVSDDATVLVEQDVVRVDAVTFRGALVMSIRGDAECQARYDIEMTRRR